MKRTTITCALVTLALVGCGGGGDGGGDNTAGSPSHTSPTYVTSGGLQWSAPSDDLYINPSLVYSLNTIETTASDYCSQQTCDASGNNCAPTNFNRQTGWRLPTWQQLQDFYTSGAVPATWNRSETWTDENGIALNLADGTTVIRLNMDGTAKFRVTCVKPI